MDGNLPSPTPVCSRERRSGRSTPLTSASKRATSATQTSRRTSNSTPRTSTTVSQQAGATRPQGPPRAAAAASCPRRPRPRRRGARRRSGTCGASRSTRSSSTSTRPLCSRGAGPPCTRAPTFSTCSRGTRTCTGPSGSPRPLSSSSSWAEPSVSTWQRLGRARLCTTSSC